MKTQSTDELVRLKEDLLVFMTQMRTRLAVEFFDTRFQTVLYNAMKGERDWATDPEVQGCIAVAYVVFGEDDARFVLKASQKFFSSKQGVPCEVY